MQKIILGTDLHNKPSELAAKLVRGIEKNSLIISIQNRKEKVKKKNTVIVPRVFKNEKLRKIFQGLFLPLYLMRFRKIKKIYTFWTAEGKYYSFLFWFIKKIGYDLVYTVISGYDKNYDNLKYCDEIICQTNKMMQILMKKFPQKKIKVVYPWVDLNVFKPGRIKYDLIIPSVPYDVKSFPERGIDKLLKISKKYKMVMIFRSAESYKYVKKLNLPIILINKILDDKSLAEIMGQCKIMPLIYTLNSPDVPLSAIEGMACGCSILCTSNNGISEIVKNNGCGEEISEDQLISAIERNLHSKNNSRKTAIKYFSFKNKQTY